MSIVLKRGTRLSQGLSCLINKESPQAKGLIACWPLNGHAFNIVNGSLAAATNGTNFIVQSRGLVSNFDGTDDYISVPSMSLAVGNTFTVSFWMRMTADPATTRQFVFSSDNAAAALQVEVGFCNSGTAASVAIQYTGLLIAVTNANTVVQNEWAFWTITKDGTAAGATLFYKNGVLLSSGSSYAATFVDVTSIRYIGRRSAATPTPFGGQLSDLRFYNRVQSASEIVNQYYNPWQLFKPTSFDLPLPLPFNTPPVSGSVNMKRGTKLTQQAATSVDWGNPLAKGLKLAAVAHNNGWLDLISKKIIPGSGQIERITPAETHKAPALAGVVGVSTGHPRTAADDIVGVHSIFIEGSVRTNATTQAGFASDESGTGAGFRLSFDDNSLSTNSALYWANNNNINSAGSSVLGTNSEQFYHRIVLTNDGVNSRWYTKGKLTLTVASTVLPTAHINRRTRICSGMNGTSTAGVSLALVWDRVLSDEEALKVQNNPWQLFKPSSLNMPIILSASTNTVESTISIKRGTKLSQQGGRTLDWNKPLAKGLVSLLWTGDGGIRDLVRTDTYTSVSAPATASSEGLAVTVTTQGVNGVYTARGGGPKPANALMSFFFVGEIGSHTSSNGICGQLGGTGNGYRLEVQFGTRGRRAQIFAGGSTKQVDSGTWSTGFGVFGFVADGTNLTGYDNGTAFGSTSCSGAITYDASFGRYQMFGSSDQSGPTGSGYWQAVWDRPLTVVEVKSLYENPWQLFKPSSLDIPIVATASVGVYYPGSDVTTTGWTATPSSPFYDKIDEAVLDTGDYITSPDSVSPTPITMGWATAVPIGTWDLVINSKQNTGSGSSIRVVLLDAGNSAVATSSWIPVDNTYTDYTVSVTTTGISTSFRIEVQ